MKRGWFGPKTFGWGASPKSWEGWVATLIMILALVATGLLLHPASGAVAWTARGVIIFAYLVVVGLTYRRDARA